MYIYIYIYMHIHITHLVDGPLLRSTLLGPVARWQVFEPT